MENSPAAVRVRGAGVELHVVRAGDGGAGPPVLLLHGFPEFWYSWRRQIDALAAAGFSVWAPDLRGYNLSEKPEGVAAYQLPLLVADVAALVRATGQERTHVVGHDWGGVIAWTFAGAFPELVDRLVVLNAPHPALYFERAWRSPAQVLRSSYAGFFQLPNLPERALSAAGFAVVRSMLRRTPWRRGAFSDADLREYVAALSRPGALTAALNYYRALARCPKARRLVRRAAHVEAETLVIWGERDVALGVELLDGLERFAPRLRVHRIPDAGHWVQNEAPEEVNRALLNFLRG